MLVRRSDSRAVLTDLGSGTWSGAECDPSTTPMEHCEGDFLADCIAGKWVDLDCKTVGKTKCGTTVTPGMAQCE